MKVTPNLTFTFDTQNLTYTVEDFWSWAFSSITTPVIRGVMIEFILARYLIDNADKIVRKRVLDLSDQVPAEGQLSQSLAPFYSSQPHGDVFDLQLTWGVTIEIKSTSNPENWKLNKTCRWNMKQNKNKAEKVFPAQYYILAVVENEPLASPTRLILRDAEFYLCSGRTLDSKVKQTQKSVGFNRFAALSKKCSFSELVDALHDLQDQEHQRVKKMLQPGWKQPKPPDFISNYNPLAVEANGSVTCGWYQNSNGTLINPAPIAIKWNDGEKPDWRDWEAAGFKFEPEI